MYSVSYAIFGKQRIPDSMVHGANMGPIWGRQDQGGPHVGPMNFVICDVSVHIYVWCETKGASVFTGLTWAHMNVVGHSGAILEYSISVDAI